MHPPPSPVFDATADSILRDARKLIDEARSVQDSICAQITAETATLANAVLPIAQEQNLRLYGKQLLEFYQFVSTDEAVRDASRHAERLFAGLDTELFMREDMFQLIDAVSRKDEKLDTECRKLLEQMLLKYNLNGLQLSSEDRSRLQDIKRRLAEVKSEFEKNLDEEKGGIWFTGDQLEDLLQDLLSSLEKNSEGKLRSTFQFAHVGPILRHVVSSETRRKIYIGYQNKCPANIPILEEAIALRDEAARLLGYSNHAEYRLEEKMEKSPHKINEFLEDMRKRLVPRGREEVQKSREMKRQDLESRGEEDDGKFYLWDQSYYTRLLVQRDFLVDQDKVAEYFPLEWTIDQMLEIFAGLFGMSFKAMETNKCTREGPLTWHEDVRMYAVWDDREGEQDFLGYLYMDLHPRPGKTQRIADLPIHPVRTYHSSCNRACANVRAGLPRRPWKANPPLHNPHLQLPQIPLLQTHPPQARRSLATLPRTRARHPRPGLPHSLCLLPRPRDSAGFLRGAKSDAGEVLLDARGVEEDGETLQQSE